MLWFSNCLTAIRLSLGIVHTSLTLLSLTRLIPNLFKKIHRRKQSNRSQHITCGIWHYHTQIHRCGKRQHTHQKCYNKKFFMHNFKI